MTTRPAIDDIARILRVPLASLRLVSAVGSRTYGIATASSDHDFVAVVQGATRDDLVQRDCVDVVVKTPMSFQKALDDQSVFALQALHATPENVLLRREGTLRWILRRARLIESARGTIERDLSQAEKRFDEDRTASTRRALHALRVGQFAAQICTHGRIDDFSCVRPHWLALSSRPPLSWDDVMTEIQPALDRVSEALAQRHRLS